MVSIETQGDGELSEGEIPDNKNNHKNTNEGTNKHKEEIAVSKQTYKQFRRDQTKIKTKLCNFL